MHAVFAGMPPKSILHSSKLCQDRNLQDVPICLIFLHLHLQENQKRKEAEEAAERHRKKRAEDSKSGKYSKRAAANPGADDGESVMDQLMQEIRLGFNLRARKPVRRDREKVGEAASTIKESKASRSGSSEKAGECLDDSLVFSSGLPPPLPPRPSPEEYREPGMEMPASITGTDHDEHAVPDLRTDGEEFDMPALSPIELPPPSPIVMENILSPSGADINWAPQPGPPTRRRRNSMSFFAAQDITSPGQAEMAFTFQEDTGPAQSPPKETKSAKDYKERKRKRSGSGLRSVAAASLSRSQQFLNKVTRMRSKSSGAGKPKTNEGNVNDDGIVILRRSNSVGERSPKYGSEETDKPTARPRAATLDRSTSASHRNAHFSESLIAMKSKSMESGNAGDDASGQEEPTVSVDRPTESGSMAISMPSLPSGKLSGKSDAELSPSPSVSMVTKRFFNVFKLGSSTGQDDNVSDAPNMSRASTPKHAQAALINPMLEHPPKGTANQPAMPEWKKFVTEV